MAKINGAQKLARPFSAAEREPNVRDDTSFPTREHSVKGDASTGYEAESGAGNLLEYRHLGIANGWRVELSQTERRRLIPGGASSSDESAKDGQLQESEHSGQAAWRPMRFLQRSRSSRFAFCCGTS